MSNDDERICYICDQSLDRDLGWLFKLGTGYIAFFCIDCFQENTRYLKFDNYGHKLCSICTASLNEEWYLNYELTLARYTIDTGRAEATYWICNPCYQKEINI